MSALSPNACTLREYEYPPSRASLAREAVELGRARGGLR